MLRRTTILTLVAVSRVEGHLDLRTARRQSTVCCAKAEDPGEALGTRTHSITKRALEPPLADSELRSGIAHPESPATTLEEPDSDCGREIELGRWLRGEELEQPEPRRVPTSHVEPALLDEEEAVDSRRAVPPAVKPEIRVQGFQEVEGSLSVEDATREASRCLRCDLEFTRPSDVETSVHLTVGATA